MLEGLDPDASKRWRAEQGRLLRTIEGQHVANQTYLVEGVALLELARRAHELFRKQEPREQRRLLDFLVSNCTWKDRRLSVTFRQPFDMIADTAKALQNERAAGIDTDGRRLVMGG
jgi:site-specific DNA recombinase